MITLFSAIFFRIYRKNSSGASDLISLLIPNFPYSLQHLFDVPTRLIPLTFYDFDGCNFVLTPFAYFLCSADVDNNNNNEKKRLCLYSFDHSYRNVQQ